MSDTESSGYTAPAEWYSGGLRFGCTQCGNCCTGPPGAVWVNEQEVKALAKKFELSDAEFRRQYTHKLGHGVSLTERETEHGFDCIFLDRTSIPGKAVCSVYEARPAQCRTWPFWPENLRTQRHWDAVKRRTPCPGMDSPKGNLVPIERIRIQRDTPIG